MAVPATRIQILNGGAVDPGGDYVLYWMIAARRATWNFALDRAIELAHDLKKPVVVSEALRCDYPWASDRLHRFISDGMLDNADSFADAGITYYPYVEATIGAGKGLLEALASRACAVVTDYYPAFFLPRAVAAAAKRVAVRFEQVDANGILPLATAERAYTTAHSFRRFLQRVLPDHLGDAPKGETSKPYPPGGANILPSEVVRHWPSARLGDGQSLADIDIDHSVAPVETRGGTTGGRKRLDRFVDRYLSGYAERRRDPLDEGTSGLSPFLHFGHISVHETFDRIVKSEGWSPDRLGGNASGKRTGWWGMSAGAEAFLDQLITWRELGFNFCHIRDDYDRVESLPDWALETLREHTSDPRAQVYSLEDFESANTHDEVWNAAQRQLVLEGRIHNYLRMLWGKKILEWTSSPQEAVDIMIHLNNKYALDGRDPNSYSGIFWCLGRYDRAWGPERPIFGEVRYMSSESTRRKFRVDRYVERYA